MKLAITMIPETGRVSPVFETAEHLLTVRLCRSGRCTPVGEIDLPESESEKITLLRRNRIPVLICGAICNETLELLRSIGIQVIPFAAGEWESVIRAALKKSECLPPDYIMPGCCGHHKKCCQYQGGKHYEDSSDMPS